MLINKGTDFLMEAHNGLSAKIVEETGFGGIWGSGLCISAAMGVRDNNEATWTQVLEVVEFMSDITSIPILLDGDTGYGDFNTVRRLVKKLEQRNIAGVCIEDKVFPKTNSFIDGAKQEMASIDEFCGKIKAAKDSQNDDDFCVVARTEAFVLGWGISEALKRAEAYHMAGADAILVHSKKSRPDEIIEFMKRWDKDCPVVIVPTKYYSAPTELFREIGISLVIWANHLLRSATQSIQQTARAIYVEQSLTSVEDSIVPVSEIFRLQGADELQRAEEIYLPQKSKSVAAVILAASRGDELGELTKDYPKTMIQVSGEPLLHRMVGVLNEIGIKDITVVRGYKKEMVHAPNINFVDNDEYATTKEAYSLYKALDTITGNTLITFGDILYKKYIPRSLLEETGDIGIVVDANWRKNRERGRYGDYVCCDRPYHKASLFGSAKLQEMGNDLDDKSINGEWIGLFKVSQTGAKALREILKEMSTMDGFKTFRMADIFNRLMEKGNEIRVVYITGHWMDVDDPQDYSEASVF